MANTFLQAIGSRVQQLNLTLTNLLQDFKRERDSPLERDLMTHNNKQRKVKKYILFHCTFLCKNVQKTTLSENMNWRSSLYCSLTAAALSLNTGPNSKSYLLMITLFGQDTLVTDWWVSFSELCTFPVVLSCCHFNYADKRRYVFKQSCSTCCRSISLT